MEDENPPVMTEPTPSEDLEAEEEIESDTPSDFFDQEEENDEEVKEEDTSADAVADGNVVTIKFALSPT